MEDGSAYRRLVGRLIYLTITRPDLTYIVHVLSQFMDKPRQPHLAAAHQVLKYIKQTPGQDIMLPSMGNLQLQAFCDADWARCKDTRRLSVIAFYLEEHLFLEGQRNRRQYHVQVQRQNTALWLLHAARLYGKKIF